MAHSNGCRRDIHLCLYFETDTTVLSEDGGPEDGEDSDFWEGVTKPRSSKMPPSSTQHENQVGKSILYIIFSQPFDLR